MKTVKSIPTYTAIITKGLLTLIFSLSLQMVSIAQNQPVKKIIVSGTLSEKFKNELDENPNIEVLIEMISGADSNLNSSYPILLKDNSFKLKIQPARDFVYLHIDGLPVTPLGKTYLVQPGDSIHLDLRAKNDYSIESSNQLLTCQLELNKILTKNHQPFSPDVLVLKQRMNSTMHQLNQVLDQYKENLTIPVIDLLRLNYFSDLKTNHLSILSNSAIGISAFTGIDPIAAIGSINEIYKNNEPLSDEFLVKNSLNYARYLYELEKLWNGIHTAKMDFKQNRFEQTYNSIRDKYQGLLREKLFTIFFLRSFNESYEAIRFLNLSLKDIHAPIYKKILTELQVSKTSGRDAYSFKLEAEDGKVYTLEDFKGKVIICKLWFNGCSGCAVLQREIEPLKIKYDKDPNVIFISLNVDNTKEKWFNGIQKGIYTSKHDLNLFIGNLGIRHPMVEFYHYFDFPQLLLIDQSGKIISSSPARPSNQAALTKLDYLIYSNL